MVPAQENSKVDVNPLLDVVFIMLIFFVVTATFVLESGISVSPPDPSISPPNNPEKKTIVVSITSNNRYMIAGRDVDVRLLRARFEQLNAQHPEAPVIINPHAASSTQALVSAMDSARAVGITQIKLAVQGA